MAQKQLTGEDFLKAYNTGMEGFQILTSDDEEGAFSWSPCDVCRQPLGGMRYDSVMCNPGKDRRKIKVRVCEDCLMFAANGVLP